MTARSCNSHVSLVGSEPKRILRNLRAATTEITPINEADFAAQFARALRIDDLQQASLEVLDEKAVEIPAEDEPRNDGIEEEGQMAENESGSEPGYFGLTHDDVRRQIRKAFEEHEETRLRRLIDDRCRKMVLDLFEEANEQAKKNVHTPVFEVTKQAAVRAFFTGGLDELLNEKMYTLAESQDLTQNLVRHLIKSSTFTVPATRFVEQQAERAVASETKFQKDVRREVLVKKEATPPSPFTGRTPESSERSTDDKLEKKKKDKTSSHHHSKSSSCSKCGSSRHSNDYELDKDNKA